MKPSMTIAAAILLFFPSVTGPPANGYLTGTTIPSAGGCPAPNRWNLSFASPLNRRWSTSLPVSPATVLTVAASGTSQQLAEIEQVIIAGMYTAFAEKQQLTTDVLLSEIRATQPLSVTRSEEVEAIRRWAKTRAAPAD